MTVLLKLPKILKIILNSLIPLIKMISGSISKNTPLFIYLFVPLIKIMYLILSFYKHLYFANNHLCLKILTILMLSIPNSKIFIKMKIIILNLLLKNLKQSVFNLFYLIIYYISIFIIHFTFIIYIFY